MAYDYNQVKLEVIPILKEFGSVYKLTKDKVDEWDKKFDAIESRFYYENKDTGEIVYELSDANVEYDVVAVADNISKEEVDGNTVLAGDKILYISPDSVEPEIGDRIKLKKEYRIYNVDVISPGNDIVLYIAYLRK